MFYKTVLILALFNLLSPLNNTVVTTNQTFSHAETAMTTQSESWLLNTVEISPYDNEFRSISESEGNDWRLMCAMAYHESRFQPDVVSHCGATGIMQIMPRVASQFDITKEQLTNVEDNILVANRLMKLIESMLRLPDATPQEDRIKLILAAYNGGIGRVNDARRLTRAYGQNPNSWSSVSEYLKLMEHPEYYQHNAVRNGRFTGAGQTLAYVKNVVDHYHDYCSLTMREEPINVTSPYYVLSHLSAFSQNIQRSV